MNLNIKRSDCKFYVDEAKRKVVCVIPNTSRMVLDYIEDSDSNLWYVMDRKCREKMFMPNSFTGVATCNSNDEFKVEVGELIAFHKAKNKLNTSFFKRANTFVQLCDNELNKLMESFNNYGAHLSVNADRREARINNLFGDKE